jgi:hypothetical protein
MMSGTDDNNFLSIISDTDSENSVDGEEPNRENTQTGGALTQALNNSSLLNLSNIQAQEPLNQYNRHTPRPNNPLLRDGNDDNSFTNPSNTPKNITQYGSPPSDPRLGSMTEYNNYNSGDDKQHLKIFGGGSNISGVLMKHSAGQLSDTAVIIKKTPWYDPAHRKKELQGAWNEVWQNQEKSKITRAQTFLNALCVETPLYTLAVALTLPLKIRRLQEWLANTLLQLMRVTILPLAATVGSSALFVAIEHAIRASNDIPPELLETFRNITAKYSTISPQYAASAALGEEYLKQIANSVRSAPNVAAAFCAFCLVADILLLTLPIFVGKTRVSLANEIPKNQEAILNIEDDNLTNYHAPNQSTDRTQLTLDNLKFIAVADPTIRERLKQQKLFSYNPTTKERLAFWIRHGVFTKDTITSLTAPIGYLITTTILLSASEHMHSQVANFATDFPPPPSNTCVTANAGSPSFVIAATCLIAALKESLPESGVNLGKTTEAAMTALRELCASSVIPPMILLTLFVTLFAFLQAYDNRQAMGEHLAPTFALVSKKISAAASTARTKMSGIAKKIDRFRKGANKNTGETDSLIQLVKNANVNGYNQ